MTDVRWGILSTARINRLTIAGIRAAAGAELVAVASRSGAAAEAYASELGIPRAHGSYEALLADPSIEAVYIPLPNSLHLPWSLRALEAGKHVLCEKPLSNRADAVAEAFDAAERAGRLLMEAFMWRYHPQTETLARLVGEGAIGPLRSVRAAFSFPLAEAPNVRWDAALDGGALMDVGCYCVSALRLLCGEPVRVSAEAVVRAGVDVRTSGVLRFDSDILGSFECAFDTVARGVIEAVGAEGTLVASDPWHGIAPALVRTRPDGTREEVPVEAVDPYAREVEDLSSAIRNGGRPRLGRDDALGQARAIEALYRSAAEGRAVPVE